MPQGLSLQRWLLNWRFLLDDGCMMKKSQLLAVILALVAGVLLIEIVLQTVLGS